MESILKLEEANGTMVSVRVCRGRVQDGEYNQLIH